MRTKNLILAFLVSVFFIAIAFADQDKGEPRYWYQVYMEYGSSGTSYAGYSVLTEREFIKLLQGTEPILLSGLVGMDTMGRFKSLSEDAAFLTDTVYINPKYIVSVMPLKGDPRVQSSKGVDKQ